MSSRRKAAPPLRLSADSNFNENVLSNQSNQLESDLDASTSSNNFNHNNEDENLIENDKLTGNSNENELDEIESENKSENDEMLLEIKNNAKNVLKRIYVKETKDTPSTSSLLLETDESLTITKKLRNSLHSSTLLDEEVLFIFYFLVLNLHDYF